MRDIAIKTSMRTKFAFERMQKIDLEFALSTTRGIEQVAEWESFSRTMFAMFYDSNFQRIKNNLFESWISKVVDAYETGKLAEMRSMTVGQQTASALAAKKILDGFNLSGFKRKSKMDIGDASTLECVDKMKFDDDELKAEFIDQINEQTEAEKEIRDDLKMATMHTCLFRTQEKVKKDVENVSKVIRLFQSFGIGDQGIIEDEVDQRVLMMLASDKQYIEVLELIGQMLQVSSAKLRESEAGHCNVVGVELSGDVQSFVPSELALLGSDREDELLKRMIERGVVSWNMTGEDQQGKGDILLMMDASASMEGERIKTARALAGAAIIQAKRQKRNLQICTFGDSSIVASMDANSGFSDVMNCLFVKPAGGTQIDRAFNVVRENFKFKKADCLIITDGEFESEQGVESTRFLRAHGSDITLIGIGGAFFQHKNWTDAIYSITEQIGEDDLSRIFFNFYKGRNG